MEHGADESTTPHGMVATASPSIDISNATAKGRIFVALFTIGLVLFMRREASTYPAGAALLPDLLGLVVIMLSILAIVQAGGELMRGATSDEQAFTVTLKRSDIAICAGFIGLILAYALSLNILGYLLATPIFLALPLILLRPIGWKAALLTAIGVTAVTYGVFILFLNLSIPAFPAF